MDTDRHPWRERVLGYEELEPEERRLTDTHLRDCSACRDLLAALQAREREARLEGGIPGQVLPMSPADEREERASADALVLRLVGERPTAVSEPPAIEARAARRAGRSHAHWLVPIAAAAVLTILLWPTGRRPPAVVPTIESLALTPASGMRGAAPARFRTGDPFNVRLRLTSPGVPVVVVVDESGIAELLHPAEGQSRRLLPSGDVVLPDSASGEAWTFSGPPGRETFLTAARPDIALDVVALRAALEAAATADSTREGRILAIRAAIERRAGPVRELTVRHER